jgi:hypothetical protein
MHLRPLRRLILAVAVGAGLVTGPSAATQPGRLELAGANRSHDGTRLSALATEAIARGDHSQADNLLRQAWNDPQTRPQSAASLRQLHRTPGFRLPSDDADIAATKASLGAGFVRRETPHFVILSDCDLRWTQARGDLLERTWAQFFRVADRLQLDAYPPSHKLLCILFSRREDYLAFAAARDNLKSPWVGGYYSTAANHIVFYNDVSTHESAAEPLSRARAESRAARDRAAEARRQGNDDLANRLLAAADDLDERIRASERELSTVIAEISTAKTIHEAVHLLAFNTGVQRRDREYPFWLSEGLATAFETERPTAAFGPDRAQSTSRIDDYRRLHAAGKLPALQDLILVADASRLDSDAAEALYSQSHALFTHLYSRDAAAMGRYIRALSDGNARTPQHHAALFTSTFGNPLDIQKRINALSDQRRPAPR